MKTTLNLDDALLADAKSLAARRRMTLTRIIEEGLQLRLQAERKPASRRRVRIPVFDGKHGLWPGIDPCSNRSMLEAADGDT